VLSAKHVFLNVGARPRIPSFPGVDDVPFLTSTSILKLEDLPEHLVIVGGSFVGLEFAQMFRRFGSQVTVLEREPHLLPHEDDDVCAGVREALEAEGIQFRLDAECIRLAQRDGRVVVHVSCTEGSPEVAGSHVLLAVGRQPNTDDLGLENAGLARTAQGFIGVDEQLRTSVNRIWALGDCNGRGAFTHTSYNDFEIVAPNLLDGDPRRVSDRIPVYGLFIDPPLARVGMNEREVRQSGRPALMGMRPMSKVWRAIEKGETRGFMKILVDANSEEILGAIMLGVGSDEAIHCILTSMYARKPAGLLRRSVHIHPTVAELIPTVFGELKPL
jgi:pyruvate/2-oxoglutarate dehydrogenase complex dihydrolipoamide dehydrogenase (E3) component